MADNKISSVRPVSSLKVFSADASKAVLGVDSTGQQFEKFSIRGAGPIDAGIRDELIPSIRSLEIRPDGKMDATDLINSFIQNSVSDGRGISLGDSGLYSVATLNLNGEKNVPVQGWGGQLPCVRRFRGEGGRHAGPTFQANNDSNNYVIKGNNGAGIDVGGFRVAAKFKSNGVDLSWRGPAVDGVAPSNGNCISDIWVEDFKDVGINLDQCHDSDIYRIFTRRSQAAKNAVACSLRGPGGFIAIHDSVLYGGRTVMSCQNGQICRTVLQDLQLVQDSYNYISLDSCHFIALSDYAIRSDTSGNATRYISVKNTFFATKNIGGGYIQGRFWLGGEFIGCAFLGEVITSAVVPAINEIRPKFTFAGCSFESYPIFDHQFVDYVFDGCIGPGGRPYLG